MFEFILYDLTAVYRSRRRVAMENMAPPHQLEIFHGNVKPNPQPSKGHWDMV
jgi:hypothetical protein